MNEQSVTEDEKCPRCHLRHLEIQELKWQLNDAKVVNEKQEARIAELEAQPVNVREIEKAFNAGYQRGIQETYEKNGLYIDEVPNLTQYLTTLTQGNKR